MKFKWGQTTNRRCGLIFLTIILILVLGFLLYTSEDPHWGSGYWKYWFVHYLHIQYNWAVTLVNGLRKTLHFFGYGAICLVLWLYFHLWRFKQPWTLGLTATALIAILDEYTQSLSAFRFGKPADVILDITGAIAMAGIFKLMVNNRGSFFRKFPKNRRTK